MAKKHLLYIHDSRFQKEPKKSGLVNELLATHYGSSPIRYARQTTLEEKASGLGDSVELGNSRDGYKEPELVEPKFRPDNGTCKIHGNPLDYRGKCLQKGCKYS